MPKKIFAGIGGGKNARKPASISALFILGFIMAGCMPPRVAITALRPAAFHEASKLKNVAVLPFDGNGGEDFAAKFEAMLSGINVADKQFFTVVERSKLENISDKELKLAQTGIVDAKTAAKIGRAIGAKGVFTGTVNVLNTEDASYMERRRECAAYQTKFDKKGREYKECASWSDYEVSCTKRTAAFSVTPRLVEVETGKIAYSQNIAKTGQDSGCSDSGKALVSEAQLIEGTQLAVLESIKKDIASYYVTLDIQLMDSTEGLLSGEDKQRLKSGNEFAARHRLDRACELWGAAQSRSGKSPALLYNLGVCSEAAGDLNTAQDMYKKADRLTAKPVEAITLALDRVDKQIKGQGKLAEQIKE
ncbi:MAG: hypothetical protein HZB82_04845 [Deltaproteobacteria bacterium]|nr:hypothetical protein [Deltaproteobacteria bacterium]